MEEKTSIVGLHQIMGAPKKEEQFPCLVVISGKAAGKMYKLTQGTSVIGRGTDIEIILEDEGISRRHAQIVKLPDGHVTVEDLGSTNGTFVNGERSPTTVLKDGDKIRIGSTTILKFSYSDRDEEQYQKNLYDSATKDSMTGCYNKKFYSERLVTEFSYSQRHSAPLSLAMLDIDHFKKVNDTHGHPAGDAILRHFAAILLKLVRSEDVVCRYGGEEFAIIYRATPSEEAIRVAERIRKQVENDVCIFLGTAIPVTVSIGIATQSGTHFATSQDFIKRADELLYQAKHAGRNRCIAD